MSRELPSYLHGDCVTLWPFTSQWDKDPRARSILELARPGVVQLHGSWQWLIEHAERYMEAMSGALTFIPRWIWGVAGDGDSREADRDAVKRWPLVAQACHQSGAVAIVLNCEGPGKADPGYGWTDHDKEQIGDAGEAMRAAAPGLQIGHTAFGWPYWSSKHPYGGYPHYPWLPFHKIADFINPQVYGPNTSRAGLLHRFEAFKWSWAKAKEKGIYDPCATHMGIYLEAAEANDPSAYITMSQRFDSVMHWGLVPEFDEPGRRALIGSCLLRNMGYHGVSLDEGDAPLLNHLGHEIDGVVRYQDDNGLYPDGEAGEKTLRALGIIG